MDRSNMDVSIVCGWALICFVLLHAQ